MISRGRRKKFQANKGFLKKLCTRSVARRKRVISNASAEELRCLNYLLRAFVKKDIEIKQKDYNTLVKSKKLSFIVSHFGKIIKKELLVKLYYKILTLLPMFVKYLGIR